MQDSDFKERRIFKRFNVKIPAHYSNHISHKTFNTYTHDLSADGICLLTDSELSAGTPLEICLRMVDNEEKIFIRGRVIWSNFLNNQYRTGVQLEGPKLEPIPLLLRLVQSRLNTHPNYS